MASGANGGHRRGALRESIFHELGGWATGTGDRVILGATTLLIRARGGRLALPGPDNPWIVSTADSYQVNFSLALGATTTDPADAAILRIVIALLFGGFEELGEILIQVDPADRPFVLETMANIMDTRPW
jgi:hypothetical protein